MADTISPLDTATTEELIAALVARHRATLGQACSQLSGPDQVRCVVHVLGNELGMRVGRAIGEEAARYVGAHPATAPTGR